MPAHSPKICPNCGVLVYNLRRHLDRGRCSVQHFTATKMKQTSKNKVEKDAKV